MQFSCSIKLEDLELQTKWAWRAVANEAKSNLVTGNPDHYLIDDSDSYFC